MNPTWDEIFTVILPPVERLEVSVYSRNLLTADDLAGVGLIDLSLGTRLRSRLVDHQTHDLYVELEPQGRVLLRLVLEGEQEGVGFWFRKTNERLIRTRDAILRLVTEKITTYISQVLSKAIKDNEAAAIPSTSFFQSLTAAVKYSDFTASGKSINEPMREKDALEALAPILDYLEKNLETICSQLPQELSQGVLERIWAEIVNIATNILVPPLFGLHSQTYLLVRQSSFIKISLVLLRDFLNGGGGELGLSFSKLDTPSYLEVQELLGVYHFGLQRLRRDYEQSTLRGKEKELVLRLVRLLAGKNSDDSVWFEEQIAHRKSKQ